MQTERENYVLHVCPHNTLLTHRRDALVTDPERSTDKNYADQLYPICST